MGGKRGAGETDGSVLFVDADESREFPSVLFVLSEVSAVHCHCVPICFLLCSPLSLLSFLLSFSFQLEKIRSTLEQEYTARHARLAQVEEEALQRIAEKERQAEAAAYEMRQRMLIEMDSMKKREEESKVRAQIGRSLWRARRIFFFLSSHSLLVMLFSAHVDFLSFA